MIYWTLLTLPFTGISD